MVRIEELYGEIENRLKENGISKHNIDKYMYLYGLEIDDLEKILAIDWNDEIIFEHLIKTYASTSKNRDDKAKLLEYISDNTDINKDRQKIISSSNIVNEMDEFKDDYDNIFLIIRMVLASKTNDGAAGALTVTKKVLDYLREEENTNEMNKLLRCRLVEIIGFMTRTEDSYKASAITDMIESKSDLNLGVLCGLSSIISRATDEKQVSTIIDISNNKGVKDKSLELIMANKAINCNIYSLPSLYEILSYSDEVNRNDLILDIDQIKDENVRQRY